MPQARRCKNPINILARSECGRACTRLVVLKVSLAVDRGCLREHCTTDLATRSKEMQPSGGADVGDTKATGASLELRANT
jgi:hypothetical protein